MSYHCEVLLVLSKDPELDLAIRKYETENAEDKGWVKERLASIFRESSEEDGWHEWRDSCIEWREGSEDESWVMALLLWLESQGMYSKFQLLVIGEYFDEVSDMGGLDAYSITRSFTRN